MCAAASILGKDRHWKIGLPASGALTSLAMITYPGGFSGHRVATGRSGRREAVVGRRKWSVGAWGGGLGAGSRRRTWEADSRKRLAMLRGSRRPTFDDVEDQSCEPSPQTPSISTSPGNPLASRGPWPIAVRAAAGRGLARRTAHGSRPGKRGASAYTSSNPHGRS